MRIKSLELIGFKSFPQRTILEVPEGVTGIVGPNGCGKSNIVDSIRWVLGEQSPKHLRGDAMEAVVFNGNERLAPLGMAEVSLTLSNEGPVLPHTELDLEVSTVPAHFRELSEIMVTRRYFRSGESEYFINKTPCRLKDITELFLGTGIGSKAYAIIEQGRVEQLINAKPEDRRLFIEEAAGTTLYRSRKLAAERKMERTRENLARVNDILHEIERQVAYLQRQAKKAEVYRRLGAELRDLELRLTGSQWRGLWWQLHEHDEWLAAVRVAEDELRASLEECEQAERAASEQRAAAEQRLVRIRESLAVLDAERESVVQRAAMLEEERQERERRGERLTRELDGLRLSQKEAGEALARAEKERDESAQFVLFEEGDLSVREHDLEQSRAALVAAQGGLDDAKGLLVDRITVEVEQRNRLAAAARRREDLGRQLERHHQEERSLQERLVEIEQQIEERRADARSLRAELDAASGQKEARAEEMRQLAETKRRIERELKEIETSAVQVHSRLESLEGIQRNYEGFHRGVQAIMREERHADGVLGVVADVIDIPQQYERAVAAVLGERLQYVIVRGEDDGAGAVDRLRREECGRGSFIPLKPRPLPIEGPGAKSMNGTSQRLLDLVRVDGEFQPVAEALLGEVVLVPDLTSAIALWRKNGVHVTLVTPEGEVVDPTGVITGGSDRPIEEELLARRREIDSLRGHLAEINARLEESRRESETLAHAIGEAEDAVRSLGEGVHDLTVRIVGAEKDIERLDLERPQRLSRGEVVRYEIASLVEEDRAAQAEMAALSERLQEASSARQRLEREVEERRAGLDEVAAQVERRNAEVTAMKVRVAERRQQNQAAADAVESWRRQQRELAERASRVGEEYTATERERTEIEASIAAAREQESAQLQRRAELEGDLAVAAEEAEGRATALRDEEQRTRDTYARLEESRAERGRLELARSEIRLRAEHLCEAMREKYSLELAEHEPEEEIAAEELADGASRLESLKERIARLGEVNVTAIDELRELEERGTFLRSQRDDLERSLDDLERTIQKLNRASRTRFAETFARANETFQKVFPRLFRGGEGRLVLTDENNLLETGVEIVVRPPGKRLDTVALLSGGEKALVAVSLIFSLFLINPTPFCILDEVDAPLDDANVGRFSQMVREMSDHSQFLIITHNKRTMESANALYGVTMQEPGVSKVISVSMK
jgi:chromosome segregation protein